MNNKKDALQAVYNWQFIHSLGESLSQPTVVSPQYDTVKKSTELSINSSLIQESRIHMFLGLPDPDPSLFSKKCWADWNNACKINFNTKFKQKN